MTGSSRVADPHPIGNASFFSDHAAYSRNLAAWLASVLLASGPIHWLPGLPNDLVSILKWILFPTVVAMVLGPTLFSRRRLFPRGLLGLWGFLALAVLWIPGLARTASLDAALDLGRYFLVHLLVVACFYCLAMDGRDLWRIFCRAFVIVGALAAVSMLNELPGTDLWATDGKWQGAPDSDSLYGGFSIGSTEWSIGMALFLPVAALISSARPRRPVGLRWLGVVWAVVLIANQILATSLGGLSASLLTIAALAWLNFSRWLGIVLILLLITAGAGCLQYSCTDYFGLDVLGGSDEPIEIAGKIDNTSARRLAGYVLAAEVLDDQVLFGQGLKQFTVINSVGERTETHNLWLKWAVYTGPLAPILLMAMVISALYAGRRICSDRLRPGSERDGAAVLMVVLLAGLVASMWEPTIPFGKGVSQVWWAAAGSLAGIAARSSDHSRAELRDA